jgi:hypothetical protein|tara:strand:- start:177 stop:671 length:495 start_codon:yes stop_codon:yes gene_type:complete
MKQESNEAFREESHQGSINEYNLDKKIEELGGYHIDGKERNSPVGKKYTAYWKDIGIDYWKELQSSLHFDYVIETESGPIFIDSKSTAMSDKCRAKASIQCSAFKTRFPNCKIYYIYHGLQDKYVNVVESLVSAGFLDGYCDDGFEEDILKGVDIIPPTFSKFF